MTAAPEDGAVAMGTGEVSAGVVWHYTDASGLLGILRRHELWASSALHMNDTAELTLGINRVREALSVAGLTGSEEEFVGELLTRAEDLVDGSQTFVLSASTDGDSLSQWRAYGGNAGYAVGLDASERFDLLAAHDFHADIDRDSEYAGDIFQYVSGWLPVIYEPLEQLREAQEMLRGIARHATGAFGGAPGSGRTWNFLLALTALSPTGYPTTVTRMKHQGFADEREVRVFSVASDAARFQHIRAGRFGLTPYVKLTNANYASEVRRVSFARTDTALLPIRSIRIGPTPQVEAARSGLRSALERFGYENVAILTSEVPYRA